MSDTGYDTIEEYGTKDILYFYYAKKNGLWGVIDLDHEEILPCKYSVKPELSYFEEMYKSKPSSKKERVLFYPDFYAYDFIFKVKHENKFGLYFIQKQLMPDPKVYKYFTKYLYDQIRIEPKTKEVKVIYNGLNKTYTFNFFENNNS